MGRKERVLSRLDNEELLRLAKSVSGSGVSNSTSRQQLIRIARESYSLQEIESAKANAHRQKTRLKALLLASIVLCSDLVVIGGLLAPVASPVTIAPPGIEWTRTFYVGRYCQLYCVQQTSDGGYILLANHRSTAFVNGTYVNTGQVVIIKAYPNGTTQWMRTYTDGPYYDCKAYSIVQTRDPGYAVAGGTIMDGEYISLWLLKTDANGTIEWKKSYGAGFAFSAQQTSDGGYIVAAHKAYPYEWLPGVVLLKTNETGAEQWNKAIVDSQFYRVDVVLQTSDKGYVLAGTDGLNTAWLLKTDPDSNPQWNRTFPGVGGEYRISAVETSDGGYAIVGHTLNPYARAACDIAKLDKDGSVQWRRTYENNMSPVNLFGYFIQQTIDGGYIVAGHSLLKLDSQGNKTWEITPYSDTNCPPPNSVQQTSDGGYIFGSSSDDTYWLVKLAGPS